MAVCCPVCDGIGVIHRGVFGVPLPLKVGECEADDTTEFCPACDGLGLENENFEGEN